MITAYMLEAGDAGLTHTHLNPFHPSKKRWVFMLKINFEITDIIMG